MPKSEQETTAIELAKRNWRHYAGCECTPQDKPEGFGYDLECHHKHVEVKGTGHHRPGFRNLTEGEFDAARKDPKFELWLITSIEGGAGTFHIIQRDQILSDAKLVIQWHVPLGKDRLESYRKAAEARALGAKIAI
jgi:hypothetical protein